MDWWRLKDAKPLYLEEDFIRERGLHHISSEFIRIHQREGIDAIVFCYISQMRKANTYCNMQIGFVLEL